MNPTYKSSRSHQNGLDFDVRYVRTDGEGQCDLANTNDLQQYNKEATIELINILVNSNLGTNYEVAKIIIDIEDYSELRYDEYLLSILPEGTVIGVDAGHTDHFHVRLKPYTCP